MDSDTVTAIATVLQGFGCPPDKCPEMAQQLHRRAGQLAEAKGRSYEEALGYLLRAMAGMGGGPVLFAVPSAGRR